MIHGNLRLPDITQVVLGSNNEARNAAVNRTSTELGKKKRKEMAAPK